MASLIPGYEYDIFISYRQKDNKGERWVSEFVEALRTELESTFKEDISVYFDINPHDGLLETHDVDASLRDKLKCLIFIPIISRTYCDPKSFAWKNEFEAFVKQASQDQFGVKLELPDGNVASRILPVRIHDLESEDIRLCESVLGGVLKGIEFIYKEPGVNRSLTPKDNEEKNLSKTSYRNQINKVALLIKQIISGLQEMQNRSVKKSPELEEDKEGIIKGINSAGTIKKKLLVGAAVLAILIITAILAYAKLFKRDKLERLLSKDGRIPIAVMPFQNMTNDTLWDVWQDGIQNILITSLSNQQELKVRQVGTISSILKSKGLTNYASLTPSITSSISKKLETNVNITGSIKQSGNIIRVNAQLVGTKTGTVFKSFQINGSADSILTSVDSLSRMVKNFLLITVMQKEQPNSEHYPPVPFKSPEAYKDCIYGVKAFEKYDYTTAFELFKEALKIDSSLYGLNFRISAGYANQGLYEQAKEWCLKGYRNLDKLKSSDKIGAISWYTFLFKTPNEAIRYAEEIIDIDDQDPDNYYSLGDLYWTMHQWDKAIPWFEKALEIYKKWGSKPEWSANYTELGDAYHGTGQYKKEKKLYRKAEKNFPNDYLLKFNQAILAITEKDTVAANIYIEKFIALLKDHRLVSEAEIASNWAFIYNKGGFLDKAEQYYRKALSLEPEKPRRIRMLAFFLIDNGQNINEGLELVEKYRKISPDNYIISDTKGWGLFKQGNYKEALDTLQKSWDLRMKNAIYDYDAFQHLEAAKKAAAEMK